MIEIIKFGLLSAAAIFNLLLALLVFQNNPRSSTNKIYGLLSILITTWLIVNYLSIVPSLISSSLFFIRLSLFFAVPMSACFFLLAHTIPKNTLQLKQGPLVITYIITLFVMLLAISPYTFTNIQIVDNTPIPVPGPGIPFFSLITTLYSIMAIYYLWKKLRRFGGLQREQIRYVLVGIFLMLGLIIFTVLLPVVLLKVSFFVAFIPLYTLIFLGMTTYAIIKHRLMDIRLVVARTVSYTLLLLFFGIIFALLFSSFSALLTGETVAIKTIIVSSTLALIMAFTFPHIRRLLEKFTDRIFYKGKYDTNLVLADLSKIMASTIRLDDLTHGMLKIILEELRIKQGAIILLENNLIADVKGEGFKTPLSLDENEVNQLAQTRNIIIFEELEEGPVKEFLRKNNFSVITHLRTEGKQVGLLALGSKESGEVYSEQDLNLLDILAPEAAVALENARAYEEIRRFNITLQEEVHKATADLQSANVKLQELDKLKDEFVSLASHELRTPMTAIKGSLSTILEGYAGEVSTQSKEFLTAAYNENDRLIRLVNNLLNISRIEAGRFTFTNVKTDMNQLIAEVVHNLEMAAKEKNLYLKYEKIREIPQVYIDIDKVKEVIINLIGNAIKFTHEGGITIKAELKDNMVITSVADTGSGITKEDQILLFKKFSQVGSYTKQAGGTGLGLYISKQIIEGLKGKVWLESTLGKGSTFFFSLPVAQ